MERLNASILNVFSNDDSLGYVQGMKGNVFVTDNQIIILTPDTTSITFCGTVTLTAIPKENAIFTGWNDSVLINPREVVVTKDTTFIANFTAVDAGVESISAENIKIFPNPATSELKIENVELKIKNIEITDISGKTFYYSQFSTTTINVSNLQQGIYLLKMSTDKGTIVEKFIKN